ncbi:sigma factor [Actinocrispum sp. NPDC049592]|uniref:RNA polymerase sigma factor n=1 Tax=Actinocrispum sp. NPDC049592 TaxID=3154835 RepID=UPI00343C5126
MLDAEVHRRIVYGDEDALAEVYTSYSRMVFTVALRVIRDPGAAEDVTQDVFAYLWDRPLSFDPGRGTCAGGWACWRTGGRLTESGPSSGTATSRTSRGWPPPS